MKKEIIEALKAELYTLLDLHAEYLFLRALITRYEGGAYTAKMFEGTGYTIDFDSIPDTITIVSPVGSFHFAGWVKDNTISVDLFDAMDWESDRPTLDKTRRLQELINDPLQIIRVFSKVKILKDDIEQVNQLIKDSKLDQANNPAFARICNVLGIDVDLFKSNDQ